MNPEESDDVLCGPIAEVPQAGSKRKDADHHSEYIAILMLTRPVMNGPALISLVQVSRYLY